MRYMITTLTAAALLAACDNVDPTDRDDMSCTAAFQGVQACSQLHITEAEAIVKKGVCEHSNILNGNWSSNPCPATDDRIPGYCKVDKSDTPLDTDLNMYFYAPVALDVAQAACTAAAGQWIQ